MLKKGHTPGQRSKGRDGKQLALLAHAHPTPLADTANGCPHSRLLSLRILLNTVLPIDTEETYFLWSTGRQAHAHTLFHSFTHLANTDGAHDGPVLCPCRSSSLSHYEVKPNSSLERYDGIGPPFNCIFKVSLEGN